MWWPHGYCPQLLIELPSFKSWPSVLGKTLNSHSASLHPGVSTGTGKLNTGGNPVMDQHPILGGVEILLVALCYRKQDKLWSNEPLGSYADLIFVSKL